MNHELFNKAALGAMETLGKIPPEEAPWVSMGFAYTFSLAFLSPAKKDRYWQAMEELLQGRKWRDLQTLVRQMVWEAFMQEGAGELLYFIEASHEEEPAPSPLSGGKNWVGGFLKGLAYGRCFLNPRFP